LLGTKASFPQVKGWDQALHWRKKEKKIGAGKKKNIGEGIEPRGSLERENGIFKMGRFPG